MKKLKQHKIFARHGELNIHPFDGKPPVELVRSETTVVLAGSHGGAHTLPAGTYVGRVDATGEAFVRLEASAPVTHADRHLDSRTLEAGTVYRIWPSVERFSGTDLAVMD
jgi:hypothetical protein